MTSTTNPYVGPRTFTEKDGDYYFGREQEARDLTARIVSERLLLFYAQSGAGKSSLINTRVIPRLRDEEGFMVLPVGRVSGELPPGVEAVENIFAFNLMNSLDQSSGDPGRLADVCLNDFLARLARETVLEDDGERVVGLEEEHLSELSSIHHCFDGPVGREAAAIVAHLENSPRGLTGRNGAISFSHRQGERLLRIHVFSGLGGFHDEIGVGAVWRGNEHTVDLGVGQQIVELAHLCAAVLLDKCCPFLGRRGKTGHNLGSPGPGCRRRQFVSPPSETDRSKSYRHQRPPFASGLQAVGRR